MPSFGFILMFVSNTKINFIITLIVVLLLFSIAIIFIFCFTRNINYTVYTLIVITTSILIFSL